jgi:hypothetical protein
MTASGTRMMSWLRWLSGDERIASLGVIVGEGRGTSLILSLTKHHERRLLHRSGFLL